MSTELRPYPAYKPSGIDWLGDIPAHWDVRRLKSVCRFAYGDTLTAEMRNDRDVPVYGSNGQVGIHSATNTWAPCIVIGRKGSFGKVNFVEQPAFAIDTTYFVDERHSQNDLRWLFYLLGWLRLDDVTKDSAIPGLGREDAYQRLVPVPPLDEQAAIVRYLDHADERIRRAISAKERLIELLTEQRQAVIHRAVTRGLGPNVRLKDSGVEWLGDVPEHWDVRRLRSLAHISTGTRDTINKVDEGEFPFFIRSQRVERIDTWAFDGEAVLTAGDGEGGVGRVFHYVNGKFDFHQRVYKFSNFKDVLGRYFYYYLATMLPHEINLGTARTTFKSLRRPMLQNFPVAVAPLAEQLSIIHHIDKATADIDAAVEKARRQVELLREYRARLVADAVTGRVDVQSEQIKEREC